MFQHRFRSKGWIASTDIREQRTLVIQEKAANLFPAVVWQLGNVSQVLICRIVCAHCNDFVVLLAAINHAPTRAEVEAERALLAALGGTCHSPVAMDTRWHDDLLAINCCLLSPDGSESIQFLQRVEGPHWARSMASALLENCDPKTRAVFDGPH